MTIELNTISIELFACCACFFGVEACKTEIVLKGVLGHDDLAAELALIFLAVSADHVLHLFQLSTDCTLACQTYHFFAGAAMPVWIYLIGWQCIINPTLALAFRVMISEGVGIAGQTGALLRDPCCKFSQEFHALLSL
jgi:hypothetical protein